MAQQVVISFNANANFSDLIGEIRRANAEISTLQSSLNGLGPSSYTSIQNLNNQFIEGMKNSRMWSSSFVNVTNETRAFGRHLDQGRLKLKDYFREFNLQVRGQRGMIRRLAEEQVKLQRSILTTTVGPQGETRNIISTPTGLDRLDPATMKALRAEQFKIIGRAVQGVSTEIINLGKNTQWAGRQLTIGLTIPLTIFAKTAGDAFRQVDQQLVRLAKVYGDVGGATSAELEKIKEQTLSLAKELAGALGAPIQETLGLAADIAATGRVGDDLLKSVRETTRLAVLGEVDRSEAMKATLSIQNAFKQSTDELADSINFLNAVENQTSTSLDDLVTAIPKAGPVVKGLGGDIKDLALFLVAMREGGINAAESANALKSGLASLINPAEKTKEMLNSMGVDIERIVTANAGDLVGTVKSLQSALDELDPLERSRAIEQLFGKFQFARISALFDNLGKSGSQTLQVMELMGASTVELANIAERELSVLTESASGKFARQMESFKANLASAGEGFLGIFTKIISGVNRTLEGFNNLPEGLKTVITIIGALVGLAGPVIMLSGVFLNFIGYLIKGVGALGRLFTGTKKFELLDEQMMAVSLSGDKMSTTLFNQGKAAESAKMEIDRLIQSMQRLTEVQNTAASGAVMGTSGRTMYAPQALFRERGGFDVRGSEFSHEMSASGRRKLESELSRNERQIKRLGSLGGFIPRGGAQSLLQQAMGESMPSMIFEGGTTPEVMQTTLLRSAQTPAQIEAVRGTGLSDIQSMARTPEEYSRYAATHIANMNVISEAYSKSAEDGKRISNAIKQAWVESGPEAAVQQAREFSSNLGIQYDQVLQDAETKILTAIRSSGATAGLEVAAQEEVRATVKLIDKEMSETTKDRVTRMSAAISQAATAGQSLDTAAINQASTELNAKLSGLSQTIKTGTKKFGDVTFRFVNGSLEIINQAGRVFTEQEVQSNAKLKNAVQRLRQEKQRLEQETVNEITESVLEIQMASGVLAGDNAAAPAQRLGILARARGGARGIMSGRGGLGSSMAMMGLGMVTSAIPQTGAAGNIAGGALMGASMGMMFGPQGAAIGAALGALIPAAKALYTQFDRLRDIARLTANQYQVDKEFAKAAGLNLKTIADIQLQQLTGNTSEAANQLEILSKAASEASTNLTTGALREKTEGAKSFQDVRGEFESQFLSYLSSGVPEETARVMMAAILKAAGREEFSKDLRLTLNELGAKTAAEATALSLSRTSNRAALEGTRFSEISSQAAGVGLSSTQLSEGVKRLISTGQNASTVFQISGFTPEQINLIEQATEAYRLLNDTQKTAAISIVNVKQQTDILGQALANQNLEDFINNLNKAEDSGDLLSGSVNGVIDSLSGLDPTEKTALKQLQINGISSANIMALLKFRVEGLNDDLSKLAGYSGTRIQVYIDYIVSKEKAEELRKEAEEAISSINISASPSGSGEANKKALQDRLKALQEIERKERNIEKIKQLQLKHEEKMRGLSLDYLSAISAGDFNAALAAQLDMQQQSIGFVQERAQTEKEISRDDEKAKLQAQIDAIGKGTSASNKLANATKTAQASVRSTLATLVKTFGVGGDAVAALEQFNKSAQLKELRQKLLSFGLDKEQIKSILNSIRADIEAAINETLNRTLDLSNMPSHYRDLLNLESKMTKGKNNVPTPAPGPTPTPKPSPTMNVPHSLGLGKWSGGKVSGYFSGGRVYGPGNSVSDSVWIKASRDEYVVRAAAARKYGYDKMDQINAMNYREDPQVVAGGDNIKVYVNKIQILEPGASADEIIATMEKKLFAAKNRKKDKRYLSI